MRPGSNRLGPYGSRWWSDDICGELHFGQERVIYPVLSFSFLNAMYNDYVARLALSLTIGTTLNLPTPPFPQPANSHIFLLFSLPSDTMNTRLPR